MCKVWRMQNKPCQTVLDERAAAGGTYADDVDVSRRSPLPSFPPSLLP